MIYVEDLPLDEAVYTFVDTDSIPTHIAASTLRSCIERSKWEIYTCMFAPGLKEALERGDMGVEEDHAMRLSDEALETPLMVGEWADKHIIIDGAHRLWRRWKRGDEWFPAYCVPQRVWREFVICDMPGDGKFWNHWNRNTKVRG